MIKRLQKIGLVLMVVGLGSLAGQPALAGLPHLAAAQAGSSSNYVGKQPGVSASQAAAAARGKVGGRVISVKPREGGGGYRVRMLVDGERVITVSVDNNGRVKE